MGMLGLRDFVVVTPPFNHHHHLHLNQDPIMVNDQIHGPNPPMALGVGVIPLLSSAPQNVEDPNSLHNNGRSKFNGMQLWEENPNSSRYLQRSSSVPHNHSSSSVNLVQSSGGSGGSGSTSGPTCQDCGNQAKKDCSFRRCRTCCKSRSFDCPTHVKSTWVSATRRRERQVMAAGATAGLSGSTVGPKKPRLTTSQTAATTSRTSTSNATTPRSFDTSSTPQNSGFKEILPAQVRAPAVFKCVRVTAIEDGEDQFAYETAIKIGGHVFKGLLYDQGVDGRTGVSSSSPVLNPYEAANGGGLLGGSNYGNPIN